MNEYGKEVKKHMDAYMSNKDSIDNEVSDIQNAMHGVEVRGALAAGVKKSFDKSKDAEGKAEEAHDVMENIMQEGFDNAALEANFEQKLEDEIRKLQPEWTQFKDQTNQQLADTTEDIFKSSLLQHKSRKPTILWIDDDGHEGVYTKIAPLLREYNIKMSSAIITNRGHGFPIPGLPEHTPGSRFMSYNQMTELHHEGIIEFVCHSHTHDINYRLTDMTIAEMHEELKTNQDIIRKLGWNYRHFVYPFGSENEMVHNVIRQYFKSAFDVGGGVVTTPLNQFKIPRISADAPNNFEDVKFYIDQAIEKNTLVVMTTHVDQYGGLDMDKMRQIIEYALSKGVEFVTVDEAMNEFGNLLQIGEDSIGFNGDIFGKRIGVYREGYLDYEPNAPITVFQKGTVSRLKFRLIDLEAYHILQDTRYTNGYGFIEVHRDLSEDVFSFQKFIDVNNKKTFIRKWDNNAGDWGIWEELGSALYSKNNIHNAPPNNYYNFKNTIEKVLTANSAEYGLNSGGLIFTEKDNENSYTHQIFIPARTGMTDNAIKIRNANNQGTSWENWNTIPINTLNYNRTFSNITIPANNSIDLISNYSSAKVNAYYAEIVKTPLPTGVNVKVYCWEDGVLVIRVSNSLNSEVTLNNLEIQIKKIVF